MLLAGPLEGALDSYAESWLGGQQVAESRSETRPGATGRFWRFGTAAEPQCLLLLQDGAVVYGLHVRATGAAWARDEAAIEEMIASVERHVPERYAREGNAEWGYSLGVPESWHSTRQLISGQSLLRQYQSPALAADRDGGTVHAFLSLTIEPAPGEGSVQEFRSATLARLGKAHRVMRHEDWREGFRDVARSETQLSSSRMHRYYLSAGGRGYCLSCEAREDVFHRAGAWCDLIASTLEVHG